MCLLGGHLWVIFASGLGDEIDIIMVIIKIAVLE